MNVHVLQTVWNRLYWLRIPRGLSKTVGNHIFDRMVRTEWYDRTDRNGDQWKSLVLVNVSLLMDFGSLIQNRTPVTQIKANDKNVCLHIYVGKPDIKTIKVCTNSKNFLQLYKIWLERIFMVFFQWQVWQFYY